MTTIADIAAEVRKELARRDGVERALEEQVGGVPFKLMTKETAEAIIRGIRSGEVIGVPERKFRIIEKIAAGKPWGTATTFQLSDLERNRIGLSKDRALGWLRRVPGIDRVCARYRRLEQDDIKVRKLHGESAQAEAFAAEMAQVTPRKLKLVKRKPIELGLLPKTPTDRYMYELKLMGQPTTGHIWPPKTAKQLEAIGRCRILGWGRYQDFRERIESYDFPDIARDEDESMSVYKLDGLVEIEPEPAAVPSGLQIMGGGFSSPQPIEKAMG